jgi:hypothetical protein
MATFNPLTADTTVISAIETTARTGRVREAARVADRELDIGRLRWDDLHDR